MSGAMKVRVGIGLGTLSGAADPIRFNAIVAKHLGSIRSGCLSELGPRLPTQ